MSVISKVLLILTTSALSSTAMAIPKLGDSAFYTGDLTLGQHVVQYSKSVEFAHFDFTVQKNVQAVVEIMGALRETRREAMMGEDEVTAILQSCENYGGQRETVTIPLGEYETCAVPVNNGEIVGTYWFGDVPFGIVKADYVTILKHETAPDQPNLIRVQYNLSLFTKR